MAHQKYFWKTCYSSYYTYTNNNGYVDQPRLRIFSPTHFFAYVFFHVISESTSERDCRGTFTC